MLLLRALRNRGVALLWGGQALSSIGDEVYRVALIWLAVGMIGAKAGYLAASQLAALFLLSLLGGRWADEWDHRRTMILVDLCRGLIVLLPVAAFFFGRITLPVLFAVALPVSALSAFFDPALQATIPDVSGDPETREAATGLMALTTRLARAAGPGLIALFSRWVATIHFFTIDAASFAISALSIKSLPPVRRRDDPAQERFRGSPAAAWRRLAASPLMSDIVLVRASVAALWSLAYGLGLALVVTRLAPGDLGAFGAMVGCYGAGNVLGSLVLGNMRRRRPATILFSGYTALGAGFVLMGTAASLRHLGAAAFAAAFAGPFNDVPFYDLLQTRYRGDDVPRLYRLVRACETGASLVLMAVSPLLFAAFSPSLVMGACGAGIAVLGLAGVAPAFRLEASPLERLAPAAAPPDR